MLTNHRRKGFLWVFISAYNRLMPQTKEESDNVILLHKAVKGKNQKRKCGTLSAKEENHMKVIYVSRRNIAKSAVKKCHFLYESRI